MFKSGKSDDFFNSEELKPFNFSSFGNYDKADKLNGKDNIFGGDTNFDFSETFKSSDKAK